MAYTQENRQLAIKTPLGADTLLLTHIEGVERVSGLFQFHLDLVSEELGIRPQDIVGKNVTVSIARPDGDKRFINGYVKRFRGGRRDDRLREYQAEVVPWLWFLTRTTDCKIFQEMSVPEIIEAVFGDHGFADFETDKLTQSGATAINERKLEYCVQYRETDFAFISRLLEDQGVYYYFEHEDGRHTMVLGDAKGTHEKCAEDVVEYVAESSHPRGIFEWFHDYEVRSSEWTYTDYDFKNPKADLTGNTKTLPANNLPNRPGDLEFEYFDYPGNHSTVDEGRQLAEIRMGEDEQDYNVVTGKSCCRSFMPGKKFKLKDTHLDSEDGGTYVLTSVRHMASEPASYESGNDGTVVEYLNEFACIPDSVDYRPPRVTPIPFVKGPQPAIVVGPAGADVYPDEHGRVKVQFYWDRYGKEDENSTCWIRVSQTWAGNTWGSMHIPWVGQEVIVDFYEGNPDRPIITGRVYNEDQKTPLNLPDYKYKNVVARDEYGNEIVFDHTEGDEHIRIHSPHHNSTIEVGRSVALTTTSTENSVTIGDKTSYLYGNKINVHNGWTHSFVVGPQSGVALGAKGDLFLGTNIGFTVGAKSSITIAGTFDASIGFAAKYVKGKQVEINDSGFSKSTGKDIRLDSDQLIAFLGGKDDKSIARLDNSRIHLSYDGGASDQTEAAAKNTCKYVAAGSLAVIAAATSSITGVCASVVNAKAEAENEIALNKAKGKTIQKEKQRELIHARDHYDAEKTQALGSACCVTSLASIAAVVAVGLSLKDAPSKDTKHKAPDSELILDAKRALLRAAEKGKRGAVGINTKSGRVSIVHEKNKNGMQVTEANSVAFKASQVIIEASDKTHIKKGQIWHKNLKVL